MSTRRKGFSLVELLVVIAIISILLAIIIPVYGRAKEKARQSDCAAQRGNHPPRRPHLQEGERGRRLAVHRRRLGRLRRPPLPR